LAPSLRTALALLTLFTTSCATMSEPADRKLVGRWRATNLNQTAEYIFAADGTFSGWVKAGSATISKFTGKWSVASGAILYEYTSDEMGTIPPGTKDRDKLVKIAPDFILIQAADGSERRYVRMPQ